MWKQLINAWRSDSLLDQAWNESFEMLEIDRTMFHEAVRVLRGSHDTEVSAEIRALDKKVNKYEREVRRKVMTHCTVEGSSELTSGMALVSVVIDIERVGDYCKNILDLASYYAKPLDVGPFLTVLEAVEADTKDRFDKALHALREDDAETARQLMGVYGEEIRASCDKVIERIISEEHGLGPGEAAAVALYARYLKRINAHLTNTVSSVVNPFHRIGYDEKKKK